LAGVCKQKCLVSRYCIGWVSLECRTLILCLWKEHIRTPAIALERNLAKLACEFS
jgi:hypothetical protein